MILNTAAPVHNVELWTAAIVSGMVVLAWATWLFFERPAHRWTKDRITSYTTKLGWQVGPKRAIGPGIYPGGKNDPERAVA